MNESKVVVVLGATGLLGQALVKACERSGRRVIGLSRANGVDFSGRTKPDDLHAVLDGYRPTLVINAVALTDLAACEEHPDHAMNLNALLPAALTAWSHSTGTPWIQVSTDHFFSGCQNILHDEECSVDPPNEYARSKLLGESFALESDYVLVVRTNIVGRRGWSGRPTFAEWVHERLHGGMDLPAYTDSWASSMEAGQCAHLLLALSEIGTRGLLNVAAAESISKAEFIRQFALACGLPTHNIRSQPRPSNSPGGLTRANTLGLDVSRASKIVQPLGLQLPSSVEVAQALAAQFRE
jgi:dTDP-4-dehydrorhamnose reductase